MANENEELLKKLIEEEKNLIIRLRHLRNAILGLGGEVSNEELESLIELEDEKLPRKPLRVPENYDKNMPIIIKIAFALNALGGEGYVSDIVDKLWDIDPPDTEKDVFKRNITMLTSYLFRDGRLKAKKEGNRYKYILIK